MEAAETEYPDSRLDWSGTTGIDGSEVTSYLAGDEIAERLADAYGRHSVATRQLWDLEAQLVDKELEVLAAERDMRDLRHRAGRH